VRHQRRQRQSNDAVLRRLRHLHHRRLTQLHGGRAEVASEPGRGSTFTIILPGAKTP